MVLARAAPYAERAKALASRFGDDDPMAEVRTAVGRVLAA